MNEAFDQFKKAVLAIHPALNEEEWQHLRKACTFQSYRKREFFIREGEIQQHIGYMISGLMRGYYVDKEWEEVSVRFVRETRYATHYSALIDKVPSRYTFQCLEDCEVILLHFDSILQGYDRYKGLERYGRLIAEQVLRFQRSRIEDFQFLNAEERYLKFVDQYPELFNRISLSHLSTYLGIQRPSLSRIRKKLAKGPNL